jgi:hypothetical protein
MESFGRALERLTRHFVADVVEAVRAELAVSTKRRRIIVRRPEPSAPLQVRDTPTVVVSRFEIPVGRPRVRRIRAPRRPREKMVPALPIERSATFEVVPHPERKNRRLVLTRLG